jgi:hypothetical protein
MSSVSITSHVDKTRVVLENGDIYIGTFTSLDAYCIISRFIKGKIYKRNGIVYEGEFYHGRELIKGKIYGCNNSLNKSSNEISLCDDDAFNEINVDNTVIYMSNNRRNFYGTAKIYNVDGIIYDGIYSYGFFIDGVISCVYPICNKINLCRNNITYDGWFVPAELSTMNYFFGEAIYQNGATYEGIFNFDNLIGLNDKFLCGTITYKDIVEQIIFNEHEYNGDISKFTTDVGKIIFSDGRIYEGEFVNGKLKNGKITYPFGETIEGEFNNNSTNRVVICDYCRTHPYLKKGIVKTAFVTLNGNFKNGLLVDGTAEHDNGIKFYGKYVYTCHFEGKLVYPTGETVIGHFDNRDLDI